MGFTYLIQQADECHFKIGSSENNVEGRLSALQTGNPKRLRIFGVIEIENYEKLEDDLQERFSRHNENGEWYSIDPVTAVRAIEEFNGKICVDDPYKFSINNGKIELDIDRMIEVMEERILYSVNETLQNKFSAFVDEMKITPEMAKAAAYRKALRRKGIMFFAIGFILAFIATSGISFFLFFGINADGWSFSQNRIINFCLGMAGSFVISFLIGLGTWSDNKKVTDFDINWHEFNSIRKKYLKRGVS